MKFKSTIFLIILAFIILFLVKIQEINTRLFCFEQSLAKMSIPISPSSNK